MERNKRGTSSETVKEKKFVVKARMSFKDWSQVYETIIKEVRQSERLTGKDMSVRVNI